MQDPTPSALSDLAPQDIGALVQGQYARLLHRHPQWTREGLRKLRKRAKLKKKRRPKHKSKVSKTGTKTGQTVSSKGGSVRTLSELLKAAQVDPKKWEVKSWTANKWDSPKGHNSNEIIELWQVKAHLVAKVNPKDWAAIYPAPLVPTQAPPPPEGAKVLALGDAHFGWGSMGPTHDDHALAGALGVALREQPQVVVILGDMLDLAAWGSYSHGYRDRDTTRRAIGALRGFLQQLREVVGPACQVHYLEGNHEARIIKRIRDRLPELEHLEILTLSRLVGMDGINYHEGYPRGEVLVGGVRYTHGTIVRQGGGATARAVLAGAQMPTVYGHIHRAELACRTLHGAGRRVVWAASPGCLGRVDGAVPGDHGRSDWQQGVLVVGGPEGGLPRLIPV